MRNPLMSMLALGALWLTAGFCIGFGTGHAEAEKEHQAEKARHTVQQPAYKYPVPPAGPYGCPE